MHTQAEKTRLEAEARRLESEVPELSRARQRVAELESGPRDALAQELRSAHSRLADLETQAELLHPELRSLRRRADELGRRILELNEVRLEDPQGRKAYDDAHPPLGLLKLADCTRDAFTEQKAALHLVRRELSRFLVERGEEVFHPSDLTREDFTADFTPHPILDGEAP
jgi:hypothetical protein